MDWQLPSTATELLLTFAKCEITFEILSVIASAILSAKLTETTDFIDTLTESPDTYWMESPDTYHVRAKDAG